MWNDALKLRLVLRIASEELGISDADMESRLTDLAVLLPELAGRLANAPPRLVARLAADTAGKQLPWDTGKIQGNTLFVLVTASTVAFAADAAPS